MSSPARGQSGTAPYIPELDGLRTVSVALVVLSHFGWKMVPGVFGVTVFFFISGFLITGQLLAELDRHGRILLPAFYVRRALRLYPALIVMVATAGVALVAVGGSVTIGDAAAGLFYAVNLREYAQLLPEPLPGVAHPYGVLWSLAVEEHYYMVFPLLVVLLGRRPLPFVAALLAAIALVTAWRVHMAGVCFRDGCTLLRIEHGTDTRVDSIIYGALLAAVGRVLPPGLLVRLAGLPVAAAGSAILLLAGLAVRDPWFRDTARFAVQGIGLLLGVAALLHARWLGPLRAWLSRPAMVLLGRWSYSIYLWHWIVLVLFMALGPAAAQPALRAFGVPPLWWVATVLPGLLAASLALAAASYYGVERPVLRLRRAWGSTARG